MKFSLPMLGLSFWEGGVIIYVLGITKEVHMEGGSASNRLWHAEVHREW